MLIFIIYCLHLLYIFILCCMYKHIYFIYNKYATWSKELRASKSNDFPNKFGCDCFQGNFWFSKFNHVTRHQICFCLAMIPLTMSRLSCKACIESCIFFKFLFKSKQNQLFSLAYNWDFFSRSSLKCEMSAIKWPSQTKRWQLLYLEGCNKYLVLI